MDPSMSSAGSSRLSSHSAATSSTGRVSPLPLPKGIKVPLAPPAPMPDTSAELLLPIKPASDSLLLRSTFTSLEHSVHVLKRLLKSVIVNTAVVTSLLDQLEKAEDDMLASVSELGSWLEGGYGLQGDIWNSGSGVRKARRLKRRKEREELEVLVERNVAAVKSELKRQGVGNGRAQEKFETIAKQFYHQTSVYLAPATAQQGAGAIHLQPSTGRPTPIRTNSHDHAQASRLANFDFARYNHHSTLLYAVPPSSIGCVDLLVGLYTWAGSILGDNSTALRDEVSLETTPKPSDPSARLISSTPEPQTVPQAERMRATLSESLVQLGQVRLDLLTAWAMREKQTTDLEQMAAGIDPPDSGGSMPSDDYLHPHTNIPAQISTSPSAGIEHRRPKRIHKIQKSVLGGKLRDLLNPSASSINLANIADGTPNRTTRMSLDSATRPVLGLPNADTPGRAPGLKRRSLHAGAVTSDQLPSIESVPVGLADTTPSKSYHGGVGGVGGLDGAGDEDAQREEVGRKKEGVLWGAGTWEGLSKAGGKSKWEKYWVVLDHSSMFEYRHDGFEQPEHAHAIIDLKFASVREGRGTDRRFVFEIVTPTQGKRLYQATSEAEMKQWVYAICNAIESCINGTSSVRTFDTSKLRTVSGSLDDHALPTRNKLGFHGLGQPGMRRSLPPVPHGSAPTPGLSEHDRRRRQPSLKKVLKQGANFAETQWSNVSQVVAPRPATSASLEIPRPSFLRTPARSSPADDNLLTPVSEPIEPSTEDSSLRLDASPSSKPSDRTSWYDDSAEIERRVLQMAALGLGDSSGSGSGSASSRRVKSESHHAMPAQLATTPNASQGDGVVRSRSEDLAHAQEPEANVDMRLLRSIASEEHNSKCADCGRGMKSSRWATISLREMPMVMFLCIRCVGIHRSLGTHISKPRSVDLDIWPAETILLAQQWGNHRANAVWEAQKPPDVVPSDETMGAWIKRKYVDGVWLSPPDREAFGLAS